MSPEQRRRTRPDATRLEILAETVGIEPDELRESLRRQIDQRLRSARNGREEDVSYPDELAPTEREVAWALSLSEAQLLEVSAAFEMLSGTNTSSEPLLTFLLPPGESVLALSD